MISSSGNRAEKKEKIDMYDFPVPDCTQEQNCSPQFSSIVRQCKWPSLSRTIIEIQKFCYHGNLTSLYFSEFLWVSWCERVFSQTVNKQWVCEIILLLLLPGRSFKFGCFVISRTHFCVHHATDVLCPITVTNWTIDVILRELKPILCLSASFRFVLWCIINER